jgi:hypothetical protein
MFRVLTGDGNAFNSISAARQEMAGKAVAI